MGNELRFWLIMYASQKRTSSDFENTWKYVAKVDFEIYNGPLIFRE